jgi:molybdenum cofactor synthesis domain-containing protein
VIRARVIVASNRAASGVYADTSGPLLVAGLRDLGCDVTDPVVVPDGPPVGEALRDALRAGVDVVLTSGGTGITPTDRTPDETRAVLDYEVPGIAEAIRAHSRHAVPAAALSRALAGVAGRTLVVNLPGSTGGARDGLAVLGPILTHAVDQLRGGDHPGSGHAGSGGGPGAGHPIRLEA